MKPSCPLLISKIQQVISRILAELERLFHNLHCLLDNGLAGTSELSVAKLRFRRCRLLPLPNRLSSVLLLSVQLRNLLFSNKYPYSSLYFSCSSLSAALLLLELYRFIRYMKLAMYWLRSIATGQLRGGHFCNLSVYPVQSR